MKKRNLYLLIIATISILAIGCSEDKLSPLDLNTVVPDPVTNVSIENLAGKTKITYTLPSNQDLLYVKAVYELKPGRTREIRASYYTNTMELDGFAETTEYTVMLYAVTRSEQESEPVVIKVNPLENPIWGVYRSLQILPDFAGMRIVADNPNNANIAIELIKKDSLGKWEPYLPYIYSSTTDIKQTTRGLDTIPQSFGAMIRDNFENYTDTLYGTITPLFEQAIPKNDFSELKLPGNAAIQTVTDGLRTIWDGATDPNNSNRMMTEPADTNPQWISLNMGVSAKLSRVKIYNYAEFMSSGPYQFYYRGQLRFFEVWGSQDAATDGSWDSWIKLGTFECIKPSGLPYGTMSEEDNQKARAGFEYDLDPDAPKVRQIRIKSIENWMGTTWFEMVEISFFGDMR